MTVAEAARNLLFIGLGVLLCQVPFLVRLLCCQ